MMNYNGYINTGNPNNGLSGSALPIFLFMNENELEKRLDGLDEETKNEVRKHMDEFQTVEQMEMFIKQKTNGGDQLT